MALYGGMANRVWVAEEADVAAVASLIAGFRDWWGKDEPTEAALRDTAGRLVGDPDTDFLLAAQDNGPPAGVCQLRYRLSIWTGADDCWLEDLFVHAAARRAGLGRTLVSAALERAEARGCRRIELDVNERNTEALAFYRSMGFSTEPKPPGRTLFVARSLGG
jgi:ribosomal protein S18 acetylase RimI-like enzyme